MLKDFEYLCFAHGSEGLSDLARDFIRTVRLSEPSRMVGTHARSNVVSFLPSEKMQRSISTESRGPEKAFAILSEYDDRVIEYWDQPEPINIERTDKKGRRRKGTYTPDFLVLTEHGAELVEVKDFNAVQILAERYPADWKIEPEGNARFLPGERAAAALGLGFRVWVYQPSLRFLIANLELIMRARRVSNCADKLLEPLKAAFKHQFAWTLDELAVHLELRDLTGLIQCLDQGVICSNLRTQLLSQPSGCVVASSMTLVQQAIDLIDQKRIMPRNLEGLSQSIIPSQASAEKALDKIARLQNGERGREARRWRALIRQGQANGLSEFQSLLPQLYKSGNNHRKINKAVEDVLQLYLTEEHGALRGISTYRSYIRYRNLAEESHPGYSPVHRKTFERRLAQLPPEIIARQRGGERSGNAAADASDTKARQLRAQLPWQLVSIDHYLSDVNLVYFSSEDEVLIERPWVTAMIDQATGSLLAFTVSFMSPSKRAVAKIFRECVRVHGRLPQEVILDRGSEFKSVYIASLLAHYEVGYSLRPASHPRYGSEVERFFGEFKQQWLSQRAGNLADYKEARSVDGKFSPRRQAVLRPQDFIRELSKYQYWRANAMRGNRIESSSKTLNDLSAQYPFIGRTVAYDSEFLMMTAIDTQDYRVDQRRGISTNGRWYYATELRQLRGRKKDVEVRLDPENPNIIYAAVGGSWVPCYSSESSVFAALDGPSQLAIGLAQLEMSAQRRVIKQEQDQKLAKMAREMDIVAAQTSECPVAFSTETEQEESDDKGSLSWLDTLELDQLSALEPESWEVE